MLAWWAAALCACSTYDPSALNERLDSYYARRAMRDAGPSADAAPPQMETPDSGPAVEPGNECGNGRIDDDEECDIAIPAGLPGACPTSCPTLIPCTATVLVGSGCQAECEVFPLPCSSGDGCCPAYCAHTSDDDCSPHCGDGTVQTLKGETCEPGLTSAPCLTEAECDDGNPCTKDYFSGSAENCNTRCVHVPIVEADDEDECCPPGATANSDSDCAAVCGNAVREPGEECDGVPGCDDDCKLTVGDEQNQCFELIEPLGNDCDRCACAQCAQLELDCLASGDATRDMHCAAITRCANDNDCTGSACYCRDPLCFYDGPCRGVIDAAAAADPSGGSVLQQGSDPNTAIGRASLVGQCKATHCSDVCP